MTPAPAGATPGWTAPSAEVRHRTAHFSFSGDAAARGSIMRLVPEAEAHFSRICRKLGACELLDGPIEVWVAESPERFAGAFPDATPMAEWATGVTFLGARQIVLRAHGSALFSLLETFDHEVAHVLLHALAGGRPLPRWLSEGMAIWLSGEEVIGRLDAAQRAAITHSLIPLDALDASFPDHGSRVALAYAQSALLTRAIIRQHGPDALPTLVREVGRGADFDTAFSRRFGAHPEELAAAWAAALEDQSSPLWLLHDGSALWLLMTLLLIIAGLVRRRLRRAELARLGDEDLVDAALLDLAERREAGEPPTLH